MTLVLPAATSPVHLLVEYSSSLVRLFFHIYFFVIFILADYVGDKCCADRIKLKLLRGKSVRVSEMTGWLSNFDFFKTLFRLKALPAGWLGLFMLFRSALLIADTALVATLVRDEPVQARCPFGTGMVLDAGGSLTDGIPWNGAPATVASQAQTISKANGGLVGVYKKVNRDANFSATPEDIIGKWDCTPHPRELILPPDTSDLTMWEKLVNAGMLYSWRDILGVQSDGIEGGTYHEIFMTSSRAVNKTSDGFSVRVAVDLVASSTETKIIKAFECSGGNSIVRNMMRNINSTWTLQDWAQVFQGSLYDGSGTPASHDIQQILEHNFNTMTMVAAGHNYLLNDTAKTQTQGCIVVRATISWSVIALGGATTIFLVIGMMYWAMLGLLMRHAKHNSERVHTINEGSNEQAKQRNKIIDRYTPSDNVEWMAQAARERSVRETGRVKVKPSSLRSLRYGETGGVPLLGILFQRGPEAQEPLKDHDSSYS